jgi:amino acid adenylation domain-containing protein
VTIQGLLGRLHAADIRLRARDGELVVSGRREHVDPSLIDALRVHKAALLAMIDDGGDGWWSPPQPRPAAFSLVDLAQEEFDRIVACVPGGASNVQDIYPLAPLQEGVFFHHLMETEGDPYLLEVLLRFDRRETLDAYVAGLRAVVARHDILRTAIAWEGLREPLQVVWHEAPLKVEEVDIDPGEGTAESRLRSRFNPRHFRIDLREAPLMRVYVARDPAAEESWLLLILRHHIVSDHTTQGLFRSEIYAHMAGRADTLPQPVPFRDYVAKTRLAANREEQTVFFRDLLADVTEPTAPFGVFDVWGDGSGIEDAQLEVDPAVTARIRAHARRLGVSAASLSHVAWAQVLARVSGREDVVFGTVLAGRMGGGEDAAYGLGMFINTLPVRVRVGDPGPEETVRRMHTLLADLLRHEHASLALAQRCSAVAAPAPLFTSLFNHRHVARLAPPRGPMVVSEERTNYPVTVSVDDAADGLRIHAQVQASIGAARVCALMHTALSSLAEGLKAEPRRALRSLDVLPAGERALVTEAWNATDRPYPNEASVHELFEARVAQHPDATALACGDHVLTYSELNVRANRLAHHLRGHGVAPDARVAICLPRSIDLVVAELGVLKAGAAYVPIDPSFPAARIQFLTGDSGSRVLLTRTGVDVPEFAGVVRIDVDTLPMAGAANAAARVGGAATAYVMYTSGSTGQPKGVLVPHRAIARLVVNNGYASFGTDDCVACAANPSFDATTLEVWAPLVNGGRLVVVEQEVVLEPSHFAEELVRQGVTVLWLTVGLFNQYADELSDVWHRLRYLIVGGDALDADVIARVLRNSPPAHLLNGYGPTEATTFAVTHEIAGVPKGARSIPLGRPIGNTRVYIVDDNGEPVPIGVSGELWIGGAGIAHGYVNRPTITAERFVPDPFSGTCGSRLYRTGDLGRWLPDGTIEFLGRADHQLKIRGFRVELGEIEARLHQHPAVRDGVVVARGEGAGDKQLVVYWVAREEVASDALRAYLSEHLPEYMVPAAFVRLEAMPLTPNGKVDRRALPAPEIDAYRTQSYEPPAGNTETALAAIWSEVLGVEQVGRHDNFFDLGGQSLLAVRTLSRVRHVLQVSIPLGSLFEGPVLRDFARTVDSAAQVQLPAIEPASRDVPLPLSFAQQRLWFLDRLGDVDRAYQIQKRMCLRGALDADALRRALNRIVVRHEALRTTFPAIDGRPEQRLVPPDESAFDLSEYDVRGATNPDAELCRLLDEPRFDLAAGPLIRGRLIRLADDEHVLSVTFHHIVSDGWSIGVFFRELRLLYDAFRRGEPDPLPRLSVQYADYAAWQRHALAGAALEAQVNHWRETLAGAPERLELPTDRPRPARMDHMGAAIALMLDEPLTTGLKALSRRQGTTLFMTLLAAWAAVLGRLAGQDDVVIGTPTANRGRRDIEALIGFFVNTLAIRIDLSGAQTVAELLQQVKTRTLEAQHHQDIPFEQVVELVQPVRSLAHAPLFQVMFSWNNTSEDEFALPGLQLVPGRAPRAAAAAKYDLSIALAEHGGRIVGSVTYATALFDRETVARYLDCYRRALVAIVADDRQPVDSLALWAADARVADTWNATDAAYPSAACAHHLFEVQETRTPDAVAVAFDGAQLTYAALNRRANRVAHALIARDVGPDARVAICVDRSPAMVVGLLGILKAGAAYVPLDPSYPVERLRYMLADSGAAALLTEHSLARLLGPEDVPVFELDAASEWADFPATNPSVVGLTPDHLAYVIYTSGSTGRPKGVMNQHRCLVNRLAWAQTVWRLQAHDTVLGQTSLGFDGSVRELLWPLTAGARVVLARPDGQRDPEYLLDLMCRERVDTLNLVPSMLQLLLEQPDLQRCVSLRRVLCGGEALPLVLAQRLREQLPQIALHNLYGPSEAATATAALDGVSTSGVVVPIGRPIANTRVHVLDAARVPVPVGVPGELYIGGTGVARGYIGRPALTAERFLPDPFGPEPGGRLYRTGDRGRWRNDGALEFLGRADSQIKVRGFRIEPGEIEARLAAHACVREAVVALRELVPGDQRLVAYWVGELVDAEELRTHLSAQLPEYMVPSAFVRLPSLPLTPSGKVDRRSLPAPQGDTFARRGHEAPINEIETAVAAIWSEVLGVASIGRWDHFFELGGHSLLAVQVASRVRKTLEADVALGDLFLYPVLADFALALQTAGRSTSSPIEPAAPRDRLPLSFAQQRLWFLDQLGGMNRAYHISRRLRLRGPLDLDALERALRRIVERHEALRTTFPFVGEQPEQRITSAEAIDFSLFYADLCGHPDLEHELRRRVRAEAEAPFDLEIGPLIRGSVITIGPDDHVLLVTMHHIVADGWSMSVLFDELRTLYEAFRRQEPDPLPPLTIQYADYAAWQRAWIDRVVLPDQGSYWRQRLAGVPELLDVPTDYPRSAERDHAGAVVLVNVDETLTAQLKALSRQCGTTVFMTLLAGWATLLSRLSRQQDVVVGTPVANRGRPETERLIGFFVNMLALRLDVAPGATVAELLEHVKGRTLEAQHRQDLPFEQVVELVQPTRSRSHSPLFQALFAWQNTPDRDLVLPGLDVSDVGSAAPRVTARYDLALTLSEAEGRIRGALLYPTTLFTRDTVSRYVACFTQLLHAMVAAPRQRIDSLVLVPTDERVKIIQTWNATDASYPRHACVHELFESQTARTPDAVAVLCDGQHLTYAALNCSANRLAHYLRDLGVGPDARVAICLERSLELVVGLLGVLKAGGAYVPLDPTYPHERLRYMLADSGAVALLTQRSVRMTWPLHDMPVLALDADASRWAGQPVHDPARLDLTPDNLAYVIYTSGSTGQPKGVMNSHRSVVNLLAWSQELWRLGEGEAVLQKIPLSFDVSVRELFWPLAFGGRLVLARPDGHKDASYLVETIRREQIAVTHFVPSMLRVFLDQPKVASCTSLSRVPTGGESLAPTLIKSFYERLPRAALYHMYGPTEATVAVTGCHVTGDDVSRARQIGGPKANTRVYVLDDAGEPVPVGVPGELCIGGAQIARGYVGRPAMTAERFTPDPFTAAAGDRLYRTGDLCRWRQDGTIEFLGRDDDQVKVRGFRIELGEIEARLTEHPQVDQAVLVASEGAQGDTRLVAYWVGGAVSVERLRAHLTDLLPEHMVPAAYVRLESLPMLPSGKVDRRALPAVRADAFIERPFEAPIGETEAMLAALWSELLRAERVGRQDHFFELGGHSLLATKLIVRINAETGANLSVKDLFDSPVLSSLAARILDAQLARFDPQELAALTPGGTIH